MSCTFFGLCTAEAAEGAAAQGKFWMTHDTLFESQDALEDEDLIRYATVLHLNARRLIAEVAAGAYATRLREDFMSGIRGGVNGRPTFFINGLRYDGGGGLLSGLCSAPRPPVATQTPPSCAECNPKKTA